MDAEAIRMASDSLSWGQFAAMGTVICLLFGVLFYLLRTHNIERKEWNDTHKAERKDAHDTHCAERKEWKDDADRKAERMEMVITRLTDAIRDQHMQIIREAALPTAQYPQPQQVVQPPTYPEGDQQLSQIVSSARNAEGTVPPVSRTVINPNLGNT